MHIGLIGGIGPAATEFYYRGLVEAHAGSVQPLELTIVHADTAVLVNNLTSNSARAQAEIFSRHIEQLAGAGAEIAAVTSIAGHFCLSELEEISPLPLVSALTTVEAELKHKGLSRVGLLGTRVAMETRLYGMVSGVEFVLPQKQDLNMVGREYIAMAKAQRATDEQRQLFFDVGGRLCSEQGAEIVVLAGTDMFLAFENQRLSFERMDCAKVHIQALSALA